ncbi:uncharacterized protein HMPREF1541_08942 [Cyphellophora europaea CBS 101466]|uniref:Uncharacterized protein n=1 Tax=Cyphellophora europaea (strain CBS 101466) TaxID=1220924 RepID=W2RLQ2_CYPE1|nr:uncharacterized protein HMPREF1541_08942 [Cyphellophora europaea CBS 101466]ETN36664.1 hypothetical protein HMPREF1541_08942 [Cyphellophora europaea CBS 101466]
MNDPEAEVDRPKRSRGIKPEKLEDVDLSKVITVFYYNKRGSNEILRQNFPREGVIMFCDKFRQLLIHDPAQKAIYLPRIDPRPYGAVFDWIQQCLRGHAIADFETYDEDEPGVYTRYADIIEAAEFLELPARDITEKVMKRLNNMARMQREKPRRVTLDELEDFYENRPDELRKLASSTIFYCWWYEEVDAPRFTPDEMCELSALRQDYPALDKDLHEHVDEHDKFLDTKRKKREAERMGVTDDGSGESGYASGTTGGGWEGCDTSASVSGGNVWDAGGDGWAAGGGEDANKENTSPANQSSWEQDFGNDKSGYDWADEVNDEAQPVAAW